MKKVASLRNSCPAGFMTVAALSLAAFFGCTSAGSAFETDAATNAGASGGNVGVQTGGSVGSGSGGAVGSGTGGVTETGSGGSGSGTGGSDGTGSGGNTGSGGMNSATGGSGTGNTGTGGGVSASGGRGGAGAGTGGAGTGTGGAAVGTGGATTATCPKPAGQICHEFIASDNGRNQLNYINEFDPTKNWTKPVGDSGANSPRTIEIVDNAKAKMGKAVLVSLDKGYGEFDLQDGTLLVRVSNKAGVTGACRMPDGNTALGTDAAITVVTATGTEVKRITMPPGTELRAINRNPADGHFWFSKIAVVYEMTESGTVTWMGNMGAGSKGYAVWWRAGGGAYATTGDPSTVVEIDMAGKIVSTVGGKAMFASLGLDFFSGFARLPNGNYMVANWLGHLSNPGANTPHIVEFTPANKVIWQWGNQTLARQITNVFAIR